MGLRCEPAERVEKFVHIIAKKCIRTQNSKIFIKARCLWVVVTSAHVDITANNSTFLSDNHRKFCMGLQAYNAINNVNSCIFKLSSPSHVCLFVKTGANFDNRKYLLAGFSGFNKSAHDWRIARCSVKGLLDRQNLRIAGRRL